MRDKIEIEKELDDNYNLTRDWYCNHPEIDYEPELEMKSRTLRWVLGIEE